METCQKKMSCSHCGCETVYLVTENIRVFAECTKCTSTSELVVVVVPPKIEFRFANRSLGSLCVAKKTSQTES